MVLFFPMVFLKAGLFSVFNFGQMGDFTKTEKMSRLHDIEGNTKNQNRNIQGIYYLGIKSENKR